MSNNFFEETTSNYSEKKEESPDRSVVKKEGTGSKKPLKQPKNQSNYSISERYLYHPDMELIDFSPFISQFIQIVIEKKFLTSKNKNVKKNEIYGTDDYTSNSDAVCILVHKGWVSF